MTDFLYEIGTILVSGVVGAFFGTIIEDRTKLILRCRRSRARRKHAQTRASVSATFRTVYSFEAVKGAIREASASDESFKVITDEAARLVFTTEALTITVRESAVGELYVGVNEVECGIDYLGEKLRDINTTLENLGKRTPGERAMLELAAYKVTATRPYEWERLIIDHPRKMTIGDYTVTLVHTKSNAKAVVMRGQIEIRTRGLHDVQTVLDQIL